MGRPQGPWILPAADDFSPAIGGMLSLSRIASWNFRRTCRGNSARLAVIPTVNGRLYVDTTPHRACIFSARLPAQQSTPGTEGLARVAGSGCHYMVLWMDRTDDVHHIGWRGVPCIGQAPFTNGATSSPISVTGTTFTRALSIRAPWPQGNRSSTSCCTTMLAVAMTGGHPSTVYSTCPSSLGRLPPRESVRSSWTDEPAQITARGRRSECRVRSARPRLDAVPRELRESLVSRCWCTTRLAPTKAQAPQALPMTTRRAA